MRRSRPFFTRRLVVVLITVALLQVAMASTAEANHYDCVSNDCYGTVRWNGGVDGADARISVGTMTMNSSDPNWHINSVLWVRDRSGVTDCVVSGIPVDTAWVEVGVWARQYAQKFYWGDCRAGSTYYDGAWGFVNAVDKYQPNYFLIRRSSQSSNLWHVLIDAVSADYSLVSAANNMWPDQIEIGAELTGRHGGSMVSSHTTNNRYIFYGGNPTPTYFYQFRDGDSKSQLWPIVSGWSSGPPAPGGTGGDWYASCTC